jgi:uncharacterized protein YjbI with pentapeptide repeats
VGAKKRGFKQEPSLKDRSWWKRLWEWTEFGKKTGWQWLELLSALAIPVVLAVAGYWFTMQQDARQQAIEDQRAQQAQKIENQRAEAERTIQQQNAQDEALQSYLDQMSNLLLEKDLRASEEDSEVRTLARARTLTVLERLDPSRKTAVMRFLVEAELVQRVLERDPTISLSGADLSGADLSRANLEEADLSGADLSRANLEEANLTGADLSEPYLGAANLSEPHLGAANLSDANLRGAHLLGADLTNADLSEPNLSYAFLREATLGNADLSYGYLREADLRDAFLLEADLRGADLSRADLSEANLNGAQGVTEEQLEEQAKTLEGATMPNGQKRPEQTYEDWLKSRREDGDNNGSS